MNYERIYHDIIENRKKIPVSGYAEKHHIIPRCMGGSDDKENIVALTAREHFICHYLLVKMQKHGSNNWYKMLHAFIPMRSQSDNQDRYCNSRLYEANRKHFASVMSKSQTGKSNSQFGTRWIYNDTLKETKKIPVGEKTPTGWKNGRKIKWDTGWVNCKHCKAIFQSRPNQSYCSSECRNDARHQSTQMYGREEEFIELYKEYSMNTALKKMGFPGAGGRYYNWAVGVLNSFPGGQT